MSSVWEFIKRHKGKLITGGVVASGVYLAQQYLTEENVQYLRERYLSPSPSSLSVQQQQQNADRLNQQARRHYIFDSNHRTCDDSILQLVPTLREKLRARFDVEAIAERLQSGEIADAELKVQLWAEMKTKAFGRIVAAAYGFTLLVTGLKVQISILAGEIYQNTLSSSPDTSMMGQINRLLSRTASQQSNSLTTSPTTDAATQQLFLQCIQYFTTVGLDQLCDKVAAAVEATVGTLSLKDTVTSFRLESLLREIRGRIEPADMRNMSYFLVPITAWQTAFSTDSYEQLDALLRRFKTALELPEARQLTAQFVRRFMTRTVDYCQSNCESLTTDAEHGARVAKLIPTLADSYASAVTDDTEFETPIQQILASPDLHEFCVAIFNEKHEPLLE